MSFPTQYRWSHVNLALFGGQILCRYQSRWNIKLELCPFYLSGIMAGSGKMHISVDLDSLGMVI